MGKIGCILSNWLQLRRIWFHRSKLVAFETKLLVLVNCLYLGKIGSIWEYWLYLDKIGSIWANWLYLGKIGSIWTK